MLGIGVPELVVILVIVLVLFGSKRLPELSRSIGQSLNELKKGFSDGLDTDEGKSKTTKKAKKA